ncbi:MAG: triose-phosphate isomerase [Myxococcota bacterium]|nr:triose-phosphate isomerase [Myxococcota bacterium]
MARRIFVAGNWKMHKGPAQADALATALKAALVDVVTVDVAVAPPSISIPAVSARLKHTGVHVAAQNLHQAVGGAFTGELAGEMLRESGCSYVIVGHSERRHVFGEDDATINAKVHAAFRAGLLPILCVGETLDQRQSGNAESVVTGQLASGLAGLAADQVASVTVAYEPVWAIGTGHTATPAQAQSMHATIREWLAGNFPAFVARQLRIQYGGSVKPHNAASLLSQPDIDGALVGGASLDAESFVSIIKAGAN